MNITAEDLIYMLYETFKVDNNIDLAKSLKTTPQTISNWKSRNSINAIKKKCRELGIYQDIFGDLNSSSFIQTGLGSVAAVKIRGDVVGYSENNREDKSTQNLELFEEYKKIELLAQMGVGIENLKTKLDILKEELKKDV